MELAAELGINTEHNNEQDISHDTDSKTKQEKGTITQDQTIDKEAMIKYEVATKHQRKWGENICKPLVSKHKRKNTQPKYKLLDPKSTNYARQNKSQVNGQEEDLIALTNSI